jgi:hypothetical protein
MNADSRLHRPVRRLHVAPLVAALGLAIGCRPEIPAAPPEAPVPAWFEDATSQFGLDFIHDAGPTGSYFMPQVMGSGAALFDCDDDGLLDIYLVQNAGPDSKSTNCLYHQERDGRFRDVSAGSGLDVAGYGMGVAIGDVDNDGRVDVVVTEYERVRLFLNSGGGQFLDISRKSGIDQTAWGASACFFDFDRDGWLDLVVANYVDYERSLPCGDPGGARDFCAPVSFRGTVTRLYHNRGDEARSDEAPLFEEVTPAAGLARALGPGLGVLCADFNGDHWPDIFVANDGAPNHLWINQRDGTFTEEGRLRGIAVNSMGGAEGNMGIAAGDLDDDGALDVFVTHLVQEAPTLWRQGPPGLFQDRTGPAGLAHPSWRGTGFGTVMADFDNDGDLDVAAVNGGVKRDRRAAAELGADAPFWAHYAQRNQLFANTGTIRFQEVSLSNQAFCGQAGVFRGLCMGDIDNDGRVDLLVTAIAGPARLYRNVAPRAGHWLLVRALDPALRRDAYGAEITIVTGNRQRYGCLNPAGSYLCSNDTRVHFGLGDAAQFDQALVVWPDGAEERFPGGQTDRSIILRKGEGTGGAGILK